MQRDDGEDSRLLRAAAGGQRRRRLAARVRERFAAAVSTMALAAAFARRRVVCTRAFLATALRRLFAGRAVVALLFARLRFAGARRLGVLAALAAVRGAVLAALPAGPSTPRS
jgi:hypothetical protein